MIILHSAVFVENGQLNYIIMLNPDIASSSPYTSDGNEVIVHNDVKYTSSGGAGISTYIDTSFYTMYKK